MPVSESSVLVLVHLAFLSWYIWRSCSGTSCTLVVHFALLSWCSIYSCPNTSCTLVVHLALLPWCSIYSGPNTSCTLVVHLALLPWCSIYSGPNTSCTLVLEQHNNIIKRCSLTRVKSTALCKHLMTKTTLTYISNKQNLKYYSLPLLPVKQ